MHSCPVCTTLTSADVVEMAKDVVEVSKSSSKDHKTSVKPIYLSEVNSGQLSWLTITNHFLWLPNDSLSFTLFNRTACGFFFPPNSAIVTDNMNKDC